MSDVVKGRLKVERDPFRVDPESTSDQVAYRVYRNGKVRFWLRPSPPDPVLVQNFEEAICRKGEGFHQIKQIYLFLKSFSRFLHV